MSDLVRLQSQIEDKMKSRQENLEVIRRVDALKKLILAMGEGFRQTLDKVEKDFHALEDRVKVLENFHAD